MIICTFFGHRDAPSNIKPKLRDTIMDLIENKGVQLFLVGDSGTFDRLVLSALKDLKKRYVFEYQVCLSHMPASYESSFSDDVPTVLPEGIENVFPRFGIDFRNKYMLNESDYVIAYVERPYGGAAKYVQMAKRKNKTVINLYK